MIRGWAPTVPNGWSRQAVVAVDTGASGALFRGVTLARGRLYATDFHNDRILVFDSKWRRVVKAGAFVDRAKPAWYAPFGIHAIGDRIFVTYAYRAPVNGNDAPHGGYVDEFDLDGRLLGRVGRAAELDEPWGVALAPRGFGRFGGDLLVANFGSGRINAYRRVGGRLDASWLAARDRRRCLGHRVRHRRDERAADDAVLRRRAARVARPDRAERGRRARVDHAGALEARTTSSTGRIVSCAAVPGLRSARSRGLPRAFRAPGGPGGSSSAADRREPQPRGRRNRRPRSRVRAGGRRPGSPAARRAPSGRTRRGSRSAARRARAAHTSLDSRTPRRSRLAGRARSGSSSPSAAVSLRERLQPLRARDVFVAPARCAMRRWPSACRCAEREAHTLGVVRADVRRTVARDI